MSRRCLCITIAAFCFLLLATLLAAEAQTPTKLPRVGWLGNMAPPPPAVGQLEGFRQGLREAGYIEGQDVIIEYRWAEGQLMNIVYQGDAKPAYFTRTSAITQLHETH